MDDIAVHSLSGKRVCRLCSEGRIEATNTHLLKYVYMYDNYHRSGNFRS